jgi:mono/diheme cytochrome c family protein
VRPQEKAKKYMKTETTNPLLLAVCGVATLLGPLGCHGDREDKPPRQFFPDMDDQPKWKPQEKTGFYADGRTMRKPVPGTVPFGRNEFVRDPAQDPWAKDFMELRDDVLKEDKALYLGLNEDGKTYVEKIPMKVTMELVKRGQNRFNIYCSVCHGYMGDGKGTVGEYFTVHPANFHDKKYMVFDPTIPDPLTRDGYVFHTAREGVRSMPGYAHALTERDTWAVVAYIRALQASQVGTIDDVPEAQRRAVEQEFLNEAPPPSPSAPAPAAPGPASQAPGTTPPTGGSK